MVRLSRLAPHGRAGFDPRRPNATLMREGGGRGIGLLLVDVLKRQLFLKVEKLTAKKAREGVQSGINLGLQLHDCAKLILQF